MTDAGDNAMSLIRIQFVGEPQAGATPMLRFADPEVCFALAQPLPLEALSQGSADSAAELLVLCVPAGAPDQPAAQAQVQAWIQPPPDAAPNLRVNLDRGWILWRPGRAALHAPQEQVRPILAAIAEFAYYEAHLRCLEAELAQDWPFVESHVPLAQDVRGEHLAQCPALAEMTSRVLRRRLRYARTERRTLNPDAALGETACRAGRRLREQADLEARLEIVDGQLETCEYVYELANQRMGEYRNFRREYVAEIAIIVLLALETLILLAEYWSFSK